MRMKLCALALAVLLPTLVSGQDLIKGNAFGNPAAPVRIEIYSDFQCPGCKRLHDEVLPKIMKDYVTPGKAYLIYRYFPLQGHAYGRVSAEYVCAAAQIGKYRQASDVLFAKQATWSLDGKVEETVDTVLTPAEQKKVKERLKDPAVQSQIAHDVAAGRALPVQQTPTLVVTTQGRQYPLSGEGVFNYTLFKAFLDDLLKK
jgi:protein-disulfide isomerase